MTDAWEQRLKAEAQIRALLGKASASEFPHERDAFMEGAQRLASKHGIVLSEIQPGSPLSKEDKMAALRRNSASFAGAFKKAYPGQDDTDYVELERQRKQKFGEQKKGFEWGDDEGY